MYTNRTSPKDQDDIKFVHGTPEEVIQQITAYGFSSLSRKPDMFLNRQESLRKDGKLPPLSELRHITHSLCMVTYS